MTKKLLKDMKKGLGQIAQVIESLTGSIAEADMQDFEPSYKCRYDGCNKFYRHISSRAAHEREVHGSTKPLQRRKDD